MISGRLPFPMFLDFDYSISHITVTRWSFLSRGITVGAGEKKGNAACLKVHDQNFVPAKQTLPGAAAPS